jgi:hypothetical protein
MHLIAPILALAATAVLASPAKRHPMPAPIINQIPANQTSGHVDLDEMHAGVLARGRAGAAYAVVSSAEFAALELARRDNETLLYIRDTREWAHLLPYDPAEEEAAALRKRECVPRTIGVKISIDAAKKFLAPYQPVSMVIDSTLGDGGGVEKSYQYTFGVALSLG